jgi:hypothetical protein
VPVYELINPSDAYTFEAPNIEVAGVAAVMLSTGFGATRVLDDVEESTPILFGWDDWLSERGINSDWIDEHAVEIADALDSFLIGGPGTRRDVQSMMEMLPPEKQQEWRDKRQDRERSSMNRIGESAYRIAANLRKKSLLQTSSK